VLAAAAVVFVCGSAAMAGHAVYLLHGFGSAPVFMSSINSYLTKQGLTTVNYGYRSIQDDCLVSARILYKEIAASGLDTVSFVTHSMGALVLRAMLPLVNHGSLFPVVHRTVMIAPPNHGAQIADFFGGQAVFRFILGPNIQHLMTDSASLANRLPLPAHGELGIIIGVKAKKKGYNPFIAGDNDGYLTPGAARLGVEKEAVLVKAEHSLIIHNKKVLALTHLFLTTGSFAPAALAR
jgi:hypothetical protein